MRADAGNRRRRRRVIAAVTLFAAAALGAVDAGAAVEVEGFAGAVPPAGTAIPEPTAKPGQRLTACTRADALMVVFAYSGLSAGDTIRVDWYRNGSAYFRGGDIPVDGTDGRGFRSLSPDVPNAPYAVEVRVNGVVQATATVVKACGEPPGGYDDPQQPPGTQPTPGPRVDGRYRITLTPLGRRAAPRSWRTRLTPLCRRGTCDVKLVLDGRAVRVRRDGDRYRVVIGNAGAASCVPRGGGAPVRRGLRIQATVTWRVVGRRYVGGALVATQLDGRWAEAGIPNARGEAAGCRRSTRTWSLDAYRLGG